MELLTRLQNHLTQIVCDRDPFFATAGHFFVQEYIRRELQQYGEVEAFPFQVGKKSYENLILNLPAAKTNPRKPPILIGAHFDTVPGTPGADDNATGVAVLLELARIFATTPAEYPLRLVAFDMEEVGLQGASGASEYAAYLRQQQQPLRLMIALEMLGYCDSKPGSQSYPAPLEKFYPNTGDFIAFIGNLRTIPDLIKLTKLMRKSGTASQWLPVPNRGLILPMTRWSDHAHFWDAGYAAMMVTDTSFLRNPHYHKPSDAIETLDLNFLTGVCGGLEVGIRNL